MKLFASLKWLVFFIINASASTVTWKNYRISALSASLVRIEPCGPKGFEDRTTFNVIGRDAFAGIPISIINQSDSEAWLRTSSYLVHLFSNDIPVVTDTEGKVLWDSKASGSLHWPSPLENEAYAFADHPRFHVPEWGPTPIPEDAKIPKELIATNGYDFSNDVDGDIYVFILGKSLENWWTSRGEFLQLTGPVPLLPDFAYGIWYTWWLQYTEQRAKDEIGNWTAGNFPLDVWGLDMNWRFQGNDKPGSIASCKSHTNFDPSCRDHFYNYPNTDLIPGLASEAPEWFTWLKEQGLKTYFNDHPFPVDNQTSPKEVNFRYTGISEWIRRGLSFWWFDHNWSFTVPGPLQPRGTTSPYEELSGAVWGSHLYYEGTKKAYEQFNISGRPISLSRDNGPNWRTKDPMRQDRMGAGSPAHHRFGVHWTGDGVPLMASVESMVDEAVHDFRAYVHSDCGGHGAPCPSETKPCAHPTDDALLRWTAHCVFGTITRFHQGDHRFWLRKESTQQFARNYLNLRHKLAPSLISWGSTVQQQGFPLTARLDLLWPTYDEAKDPTQYLHLNSTLVAPLEETETTRNVWIPPGTWIDGWSGEHVSGPKTISVTQPSDKIPMWHKSGSLLVLDNTAENLRLEKQDWTELVVETFLDFHETNFETSRTLIEQERHESPHHSTKIIMTVDEKHVKFEVASLSSVSRDFVFRVHLPDVRSRLFFIDSNMEIKHFLPTEGSAEEYFPFKGPGTTPPCLGGAIAEFRIEAKPNSSSHQTLVHVS